MWLGKKMAAKDAAISALELDLEQKRAAVVLAEETLRQKIMGALEMVRVAQSVNDVGAKIANVPRDAQ